MTTQTTTPPTLTVKPVSFPRTVRSEWVKLWSLRSTYWTLGLTVLAMVFMSAIMGFAASQAAANPDFGGPELDGATVISTSYVMAQLVIAVLGVLSISGEYSTGMIRSSFAAVPSRVPVLLAKALVIAVVSFVVGVLGVAISYVVTTPMLGDVGGAADLGDPEVLRIFWGTGLYLMGVGLFGLALGALLRHSAGAIAAVLGIFLLLPTIVGIIGNAVEWVSDITPYLPSTAGERIVAVTSDGMADMGAMGGSTVLDPWAGFGVLMIYVVVALLTAALLMRRRDA